MPKWRVTRTWYVDDVDTGIAAVRAAAPLRPQSVYAEPVHPEDEMLLDYAIESVNDAMTDDLSRKVSERL